jgi:excisionase family DNA binding protein
MQAAGNESPLAYSIADAAKIVGVGRSKLYLELADGRLSARKVGKRTIILADDLRAWLAKLPAMAA